MDSAIDPWYSLRWFSPSQFSSYTWENKIYLWALLLVPVIIIIRWLTRYLLNQKLAVALVKSEQKAAECKEQESGGEQAAK